LGAIAGKLRAMIGKRLAEAGCGAAPHASGASAEEGCTI